MFSDDRWRVLSILRRFGWNATSFQVLESGFRYWFQGDAACVAYVDTGRAWVVAGAPIADAGELSEVARAFVAEARAHGRRVVFFATERRFTELEGFDSLLIGEQPIWNPLDWVTTMGAARSLREQLRRARAKGVSIARVGPDEVLPNAPLRLGIERLILGWLNTRAMPAMGFLVRVDVFSFAEERRLFVALQSGRVTGFAAAVPVYARNGWFIEDLIRARDAANGTVELLVDAAMREAAALRSDYVTLGLAPLSGAVGSALRAAGKYGSMLYDFAGLHSFKAKFAPRAWAPVYLSYPKAQTSHAAIYDSLVAFARGGLLRYGVKGLLRGPNIVVRVLAVLLVPWIILLAGADSARWFPAPWLQCFWVGFDVVLCVALLALSARWRHWLASTLLLLVSGDAMATFVEVLAFDVPRVTRVSEALVVLVAISAPAFASIVLFNARRRMQQAAIR